MNNNFTKILFLVLFLIPGYVFSQNVLIYSEDFESPDNSALFLNYGGFGGNSGPNKWIINNQYTGQPVYPNTISQDSGVVNSHPDSNYLHIYDSNTSLVTNANFDPGKASERFTQLGPFCTTGLTNVHFAFNYLSIGNTNSYGEVYYKAGIGGTWTKATATQYKNVTQWQYEDLTNAAFNNVDYLYFGYKWKNDSSNSTPTTSFAIDDIRLAGEYDTVNYKVTINIDSIVGVPVCQNSIVKVYYSFNKPLCSAGKYSVLLSGPNGNFAGGTKAYGPIIASNEFSGNFEITIDPTATISPCYKVMINRVDLPYIKSDTSACFEVRYCPSTILTQAPAMLKVPADTICVGSVIDVPFLSTGAFFPNNVYIAQLSDSDGNFTNPLELGTVADGKAYPDPLAPGMVFGLLLDNNMTLPAGCNYKVRIVSTSPPVTGNAVGPFCIRHCDIETNGTHDLHLCISDTIGVDTTLTVGINILDSTTVYNNNTFHVEVLNSKTFAIINTDSLGNVTSDVSTNLNMHVPGRIKLLDYGLKAGFYYLRIIADNSNHPWNYAGTIVRLYIGAPNPNKPDVLYLDPITFMTSPNDGADTVCAAGLGNLGLLFYQVDPYNNTSVYEWKVNGIPSAGEADLFGFSSSTGGTYWLSVVENSFGCYGPPADSVVQMVFKSLPSTTVTGPSQICVGDTAKYSVKLVENTFYTWTTTGGTLIDSVSNDGSVIFSQPGIDTVFIYAVGECGTPTQPGRKITTILPYPVIDVTADNIYVCPGDTVNLTQTTTSGNFIYSWSNGANTKNITVMPDTTTTYKVTSTLTPAQCIVTDSITIGVRNTVITERTDSVCANQPVLLAPGVANVTSYEWNNGATTASITVQGTGTYTVFFKVDTAMCKAENIYNLALHDVDTTINQAICPGEQLVLEAGIQGSNYYWNNNQSGPAITVTDSGMYTVSIVNANGQCIASRVYDVSGKDCEIQFPNVMSPNGDGYNDAFSNMTGSTFSTFNVQIFDRWGGVIFESSDSNFKWDGTNKQNSKVADGVYFYTVSAGNGDATRALHGFITVLGNK